MNEQISVCDSALLWSYVNDFFGLGVLLFAFAFWLRSCKEMSTPRFFLAALQIKVRHGIVRGRRG